MTPQQFERLQRVVTNHDISGRGPLVMVDVEDLRALIKQFLTLGPAAPQVDAAEIEAEQNTPWWRDL